MEREKDRISLFKQALRLRPSDRLKLIELLMRSLNGHDKNMEVMWVEEAERRYESLEEGRVKAVPLKEIIERYR